MTGEKTTRELIYETNRDVKWICKTLQRMEAQGEVFDSERRGQRGRRRGGGGDRAGEGRGTHAPLHQYFAKVPRKPLLRSNH